MKIGYDAKRLYSNFAGLGNYSRTLVRNVVTHRPKAEVHLYTTKQPPNPTTEYFVQHPQLSTTLRQGWDRSLWRSRGMRRQLVRDGIELYHGLSHELPFGIHKTPVRSVVTFHDLVYRRYPQDYSWADRKVFDAKFGYASRQADALIAISESTKADMVSYLGVDPSRVSIVYQACDPLFYAPEGRVLFAEIAEQYALPSEYLLCVGSLFPRKNISVLLRALAALPVGDRLPLVLVGRGPLRAQLQAQARELGIDNQVHFVEDLTDNEHLRAVYTQAQALVYPSRFEGFGIPIVEALLCKTPVITSKVSSLPEAGGPHSRYVDPDGVEELTTVITEVLQQAQLRETMQAEGFVYAHTNFSPETTTERLFQVYQQALAHERST